VPDEQRCVIGLLQVVDNHDRRGRPRTNSSASAIQHLDTGSRRVAVGGTAELAGCETGRRRCAGEGRAKLSGPAGSPASRSKRSRSVSWSAIPTRCPKTPSSARSGRASTTRDDLPLRRLTLDPDRRAPPWPRVLDAGMEGRELLAAVTRLRRLVDGPHGCNRSPLFVCPAQKRCLFDTYAFPHKRVRSCGSAGPGPGFHAQLATHAGVMRMTSRLMNGIGGSNLPGDRGVTADLEAAHRPRVRETRSSTTRATWPLALHVAELAGGAHGVAAE